MKRDIILTIVLAAFSIVSVTAAGYDEDYNKACSLYSQNEYHAAADAFESLSLKVKSGDVFYNLGNCYYRLNDYPKARLAYERAVRVEPSNSDAKYNLKIVVAKIKSAGAMPQSFISSWAHDLVYSCSVGQWTAYAVVAFALVLVALALFLFGGRLWVRKTAFFAGVVFVLTFAAFMTFAGVETYNGDVSSEAIVLQQADVRQSPSDNAKTLQQMLPGAKVSLTRESGVGSWRQVSLSGGQKGWIKLSDIGII